MKKINSIIVTHKLYNGAGQDLYRYFKKNNESVLLIEHSFSSYPDRRTTFSFFYKENENIRKGLNYQFFPDLICYVKDFLYTLSVLFRYPAKFDIYFGCGGFNVITGIIMKSIGLVNKIVFYTIDFTPRRFKNKTLNNFYLLIDRWCVKFADEVWNLSKQMAPARKEFNVTSVESFNKQKVVPIGIWLDTIPEISKNVLTTKTLVFCGDIAEGQGIQLVLEAIPEIVKQVVDFKFTIIGNGVYKPALEIMAKTLLVEQYVEFIGAIYNTDILFKKLCSFRVGIAPYRGDKLSTVYYADLTKPKTYLSCGLPVIISKFTWINELITKEKLGIAIDYDRSAIVESVIKLMNEDDFYLVCKKNIEKFIYKLDWNCIFNNALMEIRNEQTFTTV